MTVKITQPRPGRARTTLQLTGTTVRKEALLDDSSALAVEYAQAWLARAGSLGVPMSGVIRRALALYALHLAEADPRIEVRAVARACKASTGTDEAYQLALLRLHAVPPGEPLPRFEVIRFGANVVAEQAALHQRLDQLLESMKA